MRKIESADKKKKTVNLFNIRCETYVYTYVLNEAYFEWDICILLLSKFTLLSMCYVRVYYAWIIYVKYWFALISKTIFVCCVILYFLSIFIFLFLFFAIYCKFFFTFYLIRNMMPNASLIGRSLEYKIYCSFI